jgi:hypothetical protein
VQLHSFLSSALDGREWSASCLGRFTPAEENHVPIELEAGWAPEPVWNVPGEDIIYFPYRDSNPGSSSS